MNSVLNLGAKIDKRKSHSENEKKRRDRFKALINKLKLLGRKYLMVVPKSKSENIQQMAILENACEYIQKVQQVLRERGLIEEEPAPIDLLTQYQSEFKIMKAEPDEGSDGSEESSKKSILEERELSLIASV
ncbi:hypothetical protein HDV06_003016 [Boothiomyces sp. JEL0866]|nr:hypothetical protein HDV06_003016 [Boothiomyces sp. JEL0866]